VGGEPVIARLGMTFEDEVPAPRPLAAAAD
jgi:hypothetical protein